MIKNVIQTLNSKIEKKELSAQCSVHYSAPKV